MEDEGCGGVLDSLVELAGAADVGDTLESVVLVVGAAEVGGAGSSVDVL